MNTRKHTPGPWHKDGFGIFSKSNEPIAQIVGARSSLIHEANACLIAATPDLLAACIRAESFISGFEGDQVQDIDEMLATIRDAIEHAEGQ